MAFRNDTRERKQPRWQRAAVGRLSIAGNARSKGLVGRAPSASSVSVPAGHRG